MKLTKRWLTIHAACKEAIEWFEEQNESDHSILLKNLIRDSKGGRASLHWGNWYLHNRLSKIKKIKYAAFAARQVLHIYEKKYPGDKRPLESILAAENRVHGCASGQKDKVVSLISEVFNRIKRLKKSMMKERKRLMN